MIYYFFQFNTLTEYSVLTVQSINDQIYDGVYGMYKEVELSVRIISRYTQRIGKPFAIYVTTCGESQRRSGLQNRNIPTEYSVKV